MIFFFRLLPQEGEVIASMTRPTFCGQFSDDGQRFISACQDYCIRLYDTSSSRTFTRLEEIEVEDVGWSILDTALSPDGNKVAYSTWSDCSKFKTNKKEAISKLFFSLFGKIKCKSMSTKYYTVTFTTTYK